MLGAASYLFRGDCGWGLVLVRELDERFGLGANTAIFSLVNALFLRTVRVSDPDRVALMSATDARTGDRAFISGDAFAAFRQQQRSFSHLSMYSRVRFRLEARGARFDASVEGVMPEYFAVVGVRPSAGRLITDADQATSGAGTPVVVISDRLWQQRFGRDLHVIGETITVDGKPMTIVGVTAPGFTGLGIEFGDDLFMPVSVLEGMFGAPSRPGRARYIVGRLAVGATVTKARAEVLARWPAIQAATLPPSVSPGADGGGRLQRITVESLATGFSVTRTQYGPALLLLISVAGTLLAIGCVNLSGLMLARGISRSHQIATCLALGASRPRIIQKVVVDGVIVAAGGLAAALPLAWWSTQAFTTMVSFALVAPLPPMTPDRRVLVIATFVTVVTGLLITALPAWRAVNSRVDGFLRPRRAMVNVSPLPYPEY